MSEKIFSSLVFRSFLFVAILPCCTDYPKDPRDTLNKVRGDTLLVGYSSNSEWIKKDSMGVSGYEAELVEGFANSIGAHVEWIEGPESELLPLVADGEYHLYASGLTKTTAWKKKVGLTKPYLTAPVVVGASPGMPVPDEIEDRQVGVVKGTSIAKYIRKKGGMPKFIDSLTAYHGLVAAYPWQLEESGFTNTGIILHKEKHVIAVPKGENAFLKEFQQYLNEHGPKGKK